MRESPWPGGFVGELELLPAGPPLASPQLRVLDFEPTPDPVDRPRLGLVLADLDDHVARGLGYTAGEGVLIQDVEPGPASQAGLEPGMLVLRVGRQPTRTLEQYHEALAQARLCGHGVLLVRSRRGSRFVVLRLDG